MKKALFVLLFISIAIAMVAETVILGPGGNGVRVLTDSGAETLLEFQIVQFDKKTVQIDGHDWHLISMPGEGVTLERGMPDLPVFNRSIIIDNRARMRLELIDPQYMEIPLAIAPSKGDIKRDVDPASVAYSFGDVYRQDAFYPAFVATLSSPFIMSDFRGITIQTSPFAYNPHTQTLRVCTSFKVRIYADGEDTENTIARVRQPIVNDFVPVYENFFVNWDSTRYPVANDLFGKMLIITQDFMVPELQPFINWKRQKGIDTELVLLSSIGSSATEMKTYIQNRYNAENTIKYIQLVGDYGYMPTYMHLGGGADPMFSLVAGSDNYPDIFVGRFSAETPSQLTIQINKSITYERDLAAVDTWLNRATGIASNEGPGDMGEYDHVHMANIRTKLLDYGYYSVDEIYEPTATTAQIRNSINNGKGLVNYTGHGHSTGWSTGSFTNTNVNALTNATATPVIFSVACLNGNFTIAQECFAEAWLRKSNGGAVAMYAGSINQSWSPPMRAQDTFIDLMVANSKTSVGGLFFNGSSRMIEVYGTEGADNFKTWNIFGDASLIMRTKTPQAMAVSHAAAFNMSEPFIVSTGVANALAALYKDGVLYARAYANSNGTATLTVPYSPGVSGTFIVTVTAQDRITYVGSSVGTQGGHVWTGSTSSNWHTASNWSPASVPNSSQNVIIPAGAPRYPTISTAQAYCNNLFLEASAALTVSGPHLNVTNDFAAKGELRITSSTGALKVSRDINWGQGSTTNISNSNAYIYCGRHMVFDVHSNVVLSQGFIEFNGTGYCILENHNAGTRIANLRAGVPLPGAFMFGSNSSADIVITGSITNLSNGTFYNQYEGNIILHGDIYNLNTTTAGINWSFGTLKMAGVNQLISLGGGTANLYHLIASQTGTITLSNNLILQGNLTILSGVLNTNARDIQIRGNWDNQAGPAAFTQSTGRVIFNGYGHQYMVSGETFNILEVNKNSGALRLDSGNTLVTCATYDWTSGAVDIINGVFTANSLADNCIRGDWYLNPGGTINLSNSGGWVDLGGNLYIYGGEFNVWGGTTDSYWPYTANASITMSGGTLNFKETGIRITTSSFTFNYNITGGTIISSGNLTVLRSDFNPTAGAFKMAGSADATISQTAGSSLFNLEIAKASRQGGTENQPDIREDKDGRSYPITRANTVTCSAALSVTNDLSISAGTFSVGAATVSINRDLLVSASLQVTSASAVINIGRDVRFLPTAISVINNGTFNVTRNWNNEQGCTALFGLSTMVNFMGSIGSTIISFGANAQFGNLSTQKTSQFVQVAGTNAVFNVNGNLSVPTGKSWHFYGGASYIYGTMEANGNSILENSTTVSVNAFVLGGTFTLNNGGLIVTGTYTQNSGSTLTFAGGNFTINAPAASTWNIISGTVNLNNGTFQVSNNHLQLSSTAVFNQNGGNLKLGGSFRANSNGTYLPVSGQVELIGSVAATIEMGSSNQFLQLLVNKSGSTQVNLSTNVSIANNLTIQGGDLRLNQRQLTVNGNLTVSSGSLVLNNSAGIFTLFGTWSHAGTSTLNSQAGTIILRGSQSYDLPNLIYPNLIINRQSSGVETTILSNHAITINGSLSIQNGKMKVLDGALLDINGNLNLSDETCLKVENSGNSPVTVYLSGNLTDSNAFHSSSTGLYFLGGNLLVLDGTANQTLSTDYNLLEVSSITINKTSGSVLTQGNVYVLGTFDFIRGNWGDGPSGRMLYLAGNASFGAQSAFNDPNCDIIISGWNATQLKMLSTVTAAALKIQKDHINMIAVTLNGNSYLGGSTPIQIETGVLNLGGYILRTAGNLSIQSLGKLQLSPLSRLELAGGTTLTVNNGGKFYALGTSSQKATVTSPNGYYEFVTLSGSTIGAVHCIFEKMGTYGIDINNGCIVDTDYSFDFCTFRNGISGGTLLRKRNTQVLSVNWAEFPTNTWGGAYNVYHSGGSGSLYFYGATGGFAGASFENDTFNKIYWFGGIVSPPQNLQISRVGGYPQLNWSPSAGATIYYIYRSTDPNSINWGAPVGNSVSSFWTDYSAPAGRYFYRVTASD